MTPVDSRKRVLVVDHDPGTEAVAAAALLEEGYEVRGVLDGHTARAVTADWEPDLVLLDLGAPDADAWDFVRSEPTTPIVGLVPPAMLTPGDPDAVSPTDGASGALTTLGVCDVLPKPLEPERLADLVVSLTRYARYATPTDLDRAA